jgi:hypothetical protein
MQKISSYLYPNKINVVVADPIFSVRWNIVYQNRVKIYQGVDNVLTIDVKNSDQKRIDISDMNLEMAIMDVAGKGVTTAAVETSDNLGLGTVNITADLLSNVSPQFLNFTIYRINEDETKTVLYADTQFGAKGSMELVGSAVAIETPIRKITRWAPITDDTVHPWAVEYFSDAVEIKKPNHLTIEDDETIIFDLELNQLVGKATIQFTKDTVISSSTEWITLIELSVNLDTPSTLRQQFFYPDYNREWAWARVNYVRANNNTGTIDKVIVRL